MDITILGILLESQSLIQGQIFTSLTATGNCLKQISPLTPGWDGTYNGNALPSSDYWFRVEYTEQGIQKEIRGHFTLKR